MRRKFRYLLIPAQLFVTGACTPYTVASTARTVPQGERARTTVFYLVPGGAQSAGDSSSASMPGFDLEQRFGLDDRSDIGIRIPTISGAIVTYKRRLTGIVDRDAGGTAIMLGAGFVNGGQHAHGEVTLITSGREGGQITPYGGFRALQVLPLSSIAVSDSPTIGGFGGMRIGRPDAGVSLELGVFYDRSALKLRRGDVVIVPAINVHGSSLLKMFSW